MDFNIIKHKVQNKAALTALELQQRSIDFTNNSMKKVRNLANAAKFTVANIKIIAIVLLIIFISYSAVTTVLGITQSVGASPHYYVNADADAATKSSTTYIQYTSGQGSADGEVPKFYKQYNGANYLPFNDGIKYGALTGATEYGCGCFAVTNALAGCLDSSITPLDVVPWMIENGLTNSSVGTFNGGPEKALKHFGCKNVYRVPTLDKVKEALEKGHWVIFSVGKSKWTTGGHFLLAYRIDNDLVYLSDSASYEDVNSPKSPNLSHVVTTWSDVSSAMHNPDSWIAIDPQNP